MAKGKKKGLTTKKKSEEALQPKVENRTKENKPEMNGDSACNGQPTIHSLWSPSKPRSPLCDNSSSLIQEENVSEKVPLQIVTSKQEKVRGNSQVGVYRQEENTGRTCQVQGPREPTTGQVKEEDPYSHSNPGPAPDNGTQSKTERGTSRKVKVKKAESSQNRKVTDYYHIRRSSRKSKAELKSEEHRHIDDLITNGVEEGLQVKHIEGKGRGVFASRSFQKGQFVVEYHGDLLQLADAKKREALYAQDPGTGCYMYYFQYHSKTYCVDATKETNRLGRLINHSKNGNCQTKLHGIDGTPHLILVAAKDIEAEEELLYDYGDRSKESISAHPWLKY